MRPLPTTWPSAMHRRCEIAARNRTRLRRGLEAVAGALGWTLPTQVFVLLDYIEAQDADAAFIDFLEEKSDKEFFMMSDFHFDPV